MGTKGSRHRLLARGLAGAAVTTALVVAAQLASADEAGESFWTPGSFGSLAATPSQPGFSLSSGYYHTSTTAGSEVARARLIRIGRLSGAVEESVSAISISPEDLATVTPGYTFATPVLGGQAAVALTATYGRKRTTDDVTISGERLAGSFALARSRFESISDTITGFGDLSPQASLRWNSGVHNVMTYMTGNIPVGAYDRARLSNIGIGHGALDGGAGYTYFNEQTGYEFSAVAGLTYNFINPHNPISERRRRSCRLGRLPLPDQAAPDRLGGLSLQSGELRWRVWRPRRLLPIARCKRRRTVRLYDCDGCARRKRESQSLQGVRRGEPAGRLEFVARLYARACRAGARALNRAAAAHVHEIARSQRAGLAPAQAGEIRRTAIYCSSSRISLSACLINWTREAMV
jgi:hypothetical protein